MPLALSIESKSVSIYCGQMHSDTYTLMNSLFFEPAQFQSLLLTLFSYNLDFIG